MEQGEESNSQRYAQRSLVTPALESVALDPRPVGLEEE